MNPNLNFDDLNCAINLANAIVRTRRTIDFTIELQVVRAGFKLKKKDRKREVAGA